MRIVDINNTAAVKNRNKLPVNTRYLKFISPINDRCIKEINLRVIGLEYPIPCNNWYKDSFIEGES
jgi:hypothetical protein